MKFGLGAILQIVAVALFVLAFLSDSNYGDFLTLGLAAFAGSFLATSLGYADKTFGSTGSGPST